VWEVYGSPVWGSLKRGRDQIFQSWNRLPELTVKVIEKESEKNEL
jgi:hypothetical protein